VRVHPEFSISAPPPWLLLIRFNSDVLRTMMPGIFVSTPFLALRSSSHPKIEIWFTSGWLKLLFFPRLRITFDPLPFPRPLGSYTRHLSDAGTPPVFSPLDPDPSPPCPFLPVLPLLFPLYSLIFTGHLLPPPETSPFAPFRAADRILLCPGGAP